VGVTIADIETTIVPANDTTTTIAVRWAHLSMLIFAVSGVLPASVVGEYPNQVTGAS
jgi:hypothetical protein